MNGETWLVNGDETQENPPRRRRRRASRRRSRSTSARKKRRPPKGFRTWKAYMDSIRPKSKSHKGGTVARRRRRSRRSTSHRRRRRHVASNPPRRRRRRRSTVRRLVRRYRGRAIAGGRGIVGKVISGVTVSVQIVGGKLAVRYLRGLVGVAPGSYTAMLVEAGIAAAIGTVGGRFLGASVANNLMLGGLVGVVETGLKNVLPANLAANLGDEGSPSVVRVPSAAVRRLVMSGYPRGGDRVGGYPRRAALGAFPSRVAPPGALVPEMRDVLGG